VIAHSSSISVTNNRHKWPCMILHWEISTPKEGLNSYKYHTPSASCYYSAMWSLLCVSQRTRSSALIYIADRAIIYSWKSITSYSCVILKGVSFDTGRSSDQSSSATDPGPHFTWHNATSLTLNRLTTPRPVSWSRSFHSPARSHYNKKCGRLPKITSSNS